MAEQWTVTEAAETSMVNLLRNLRATLISPMEIGQGGLNIIFDRPSPNGRETHRCWAQISGDGSLNGVRETRGGGKTESYRAGGSMFGYFERQMLSDEQE